MKTNTTIDLTIENASKVSTVINKNNPEWGAKKFEFNGQPLTVCGFVSVCPLHKASSYHKC